MSLGYGTADHDSTPLEQAILPLNTPATLSVHALHFVAVHQDPVAGTFTWDTISAHTLAPAQDIGSVHNEQIQPPPFGR